MRRSTAAGLLGLSLSTGETLYQSRPARKPRRRLIILHGRPLQAARLLEHLVGRIGSVPRQAQSMKLCSHRHS